MIPFLVPFLTNPLVRRIGMYVGIVALLFLGLRWYSNKAYTEGRAAGVTVALSESITSSEKSWKADLAQLQQRIESSTRNTQVAAQAASVAANQLEATVTKAADALSQIPKQVAAIPVSDLPAAIVANDATVRPADTESLQPRPASRHDRGARCVQSQLRIGNEEARLRNIQEDLYIRSL